MPAFSIADAAVDVFAAPALTLLPFHATCAFVMPDTNFRHYYVMLALLSFSDYRRLYFLSPPDYAVMLMARSLIHMPHVDCATLLPLTLLRLRAAVGYATYAVITAAMPCC